MTAVDDSVEMLSHVTDAQTVCSRIEDLRLDESFDVVLLASHLVNTPDTTLRDTLLSTAARHINPTGHVLIQRHSPEWFDSLSPGDVTSGTLGEVDIQLTVLALSADELTATVRYHVDGGTWTQDFTARRLDDRTLNDALANCGLGPGIPVTVGGQKHADWIVSELVRRVGETTS